MNPVTPNPLANVVVEDQTMGTILAMQTGLFNHAYSRALASGTTVAKPEDIEALENHAIGMARETYREKFDPAQHAHDAMHQAEYERALAQREDAEKGEQQARANVRDAEDACAQTPKAGSKPELKLFVLSSFVVALAISIAPTLHDSLFHTLSDDLLAWFFAAVSASFVGVMLTWAVTSGRSGTLSWIGFGAGVALGVGLFAVRLSSVQDAGEALFATGLTVVEIAAVLLLEYLARDLRTREAAWSLKSAEETQAIARRDACHQDLARWQARVQEKHRAVNEKIALVEDRFNRNIHIEELEQVAVKAVRDGYNRGISENIGRVFGVTRRTQ